MKISRIIPRRHGRGVDPDAWAAALADGAWVNTTELLKHDGDAWVRRAHFSASASPVIVKCVPTAGLAARAKQLAHRSRADRQWLGSDWLSAHALRAPRNILLAGADIDGAPCDLLVIESINARSVLDHLGAADLPVRDEHAAARALGRLLVAQLALARYNRDCKPSNLLVVRDANGAPDIMTIDAVAIRRTGRSPRPRLVQMLATLVIEAIGTGVEPRRTLKARVIREVVTSLPRLGARQLWRDVAAHVSSHGDPRPKIDPLSSPVRPHSVEPRGSHAP